MIRKPNIKILCLLSFYLIFVPSFESKNIFAAGFDFSVTAMDCGKSLATKPDLEESISTQHFLPSVLKNFLQGTKRVVLTFDDGPHPNATPFILDTLKKHDIKAIFFILGLQAVKYPELVKRIYEEGHILGNHTYNHKYLSELNEKEIREEICKTNDLIFSITGVKPVYLRPPYGAGTKSALIRKIIEEEGMKLFLWTVDSKDWQNKNTKSIQTSVEAQLGIGKINKVGGAVLLHDIYPTTASSLDKLIASINASNYMFVTPEEIVMSDDDILFARNKNNPKYYNPELSGNKLIVALLTPEKKDIKTLDILRAYRDGNLMLFLALNK